VAGIDSCITSPLSCLAGKVIGASFSGFFTTLTQWVIDSCSWVLSAASAVLQATSDPQRITQAANAEFSLLLRAAPIIMVSGLLVSTLVLLQRGEPGRLVREYALVAPLLVLGIGVARPMALMLLTIVDELCSIAVPSSGGNINQLVNALAAMPTGTPGFVLFLLAIGLVVGSMLLWVELVVRSVFLTLLLCLTPILFSLSAFSPLRRVAWRTVETFAALAFSKFVIVVTLSLGLSEISSDSATLIVQGIATMGLAALSPYLILRLVPLVESSALHGLEGFRQRVSRNVQAIPASPVGVGIGMLRPKPPTPEAPSRSEDLGLSEWESSPTQTIPTYDGDPVAPPIGVARHPSGHVAPLSDRLGPVLGWHDDE
jgi:hypothetical protein